MDIYSRTKTSITW